MADNNHPANNGHSPFRRYVPPVNNGVGNGNAVPLSPPPLPGGGPTHTPGITPRRKRRSRNRWRDWIQSTPSTTKNGIDRAHSPSRRGPLPPPSATSSRRSVQTPLGDSFNHSPSAPRRHEPSSFVKDSAPPRSPRARANNNAQRPTSANKVTPLHRQPIWSTPADPAERPTVRRDRKPRRSRKAPQPILYGIRLLILGTGIAAIAGTVLSSLNPGKEAASSGASNDAAEVTTRNSRSGSVVAQPLPLSDELVTVETDLVALESMTPGLTQSVFFYDLETGNYIDLNGTESVAAASTIKVPILIAFLAAVDAGEVRLDEAVTLQEDLLAGGSGALQNQELGTQYTALEVATEMIVNSDNTATNMLINLLGGINALNEQFRSWGLEATVLRNPLPDLDGTNTTSAADLVRVLALVDQGELLEMRSRDRLFSIMQRTANRTLIPDGLVDESAIAYNKTGDIGTALGDIALVDVANGKRYLLGVLVDRPFNDGRASELIRRVSGRVYEEMSQPVSPTGSGQVPTTSPEASPEDDGAPPESTESDVPTDVEPETAPIPETYSVPESEPLVGPDVPPG